MTFGFGKNVKISKTHTACKRESGFWFFGLKLGDQIKGFSLVEECNVECIHSHNDLQQSQSFRWNKTALVIAKKHKPIQRNETLAP